MTTKSDPKRSSTPQKADKTAKGAKVQQGENARTGKTRTGKTPTGKADSGGDRPSPTGSAVVRNIAGVVAIVALVAAIACVGWFGYRAYEVYAVTQPTQQSRDDATGAAEQAMLNVTTIDPKKMDTFNQRLQSSFAGDALDQVRQQVVATLNPQLQKAGAEVGSTTSRVVRSAPTEVNRDEGTAQVLVYLAVSGQTPGQATETPHTMGFLVGMQKFGDTWKAVKVSPLDGISYADDGSAGNGQQPAPTDAPAGGN
ncbi:hypothetical protein ACLQ3C_09985 [Gordonia sp. DT30]|uniref:hypothetical protein n=1 Tax=unclassified Gordonia (in: high G+C Gram-positive bacteria) TaxID=2657482 RepID=UPI003CF097BC